MKKIEELESITKQMINKEIDIVNVPVNETFMLSYLHTQDAENECLNFYNMIWHQDVPEILELCKKYELEEFSISSNMSDLLEVLQEFQNAGCRIVGMTNAVPNYPTDMPSIPAILMEVM